MPDVQHMDSSMRTTGNRRCGHTTPLRFPKASPTATNQCPPPRVSSDWGDSGAGLPAAWGGVGSSAQGAPTQLRWAPGGSCLPGHSCTALWVRLASGASAMRPSPCTPPGPAPQHSPSLHPWLHGVKRQQSESQGLDPTLRVSVQGHGRHLSPSLPSVSMGTCSETKDKALDSPPRAQPRLLTAFSPHRKDGAQAHTGRSEKARDTHSACVCGTHHHHPSLPSGETLKPPGEGLCGSARSLSPLRGHSQGP